MGFGGEDCAISLTDLPQPRGDPAGAGGPGSAEGAAFLNLGEIDGFQDLQQKSEDLVPEGGVLASGGGDGPGESLPGLSSSALRNMLLYAESVNSFGARERRNLAQLDAQTGDVGCGFYDIFYEGGGSASCFYDAIPCTKENAFYDFYTGSFINHAPVTHLDEKFSSSPFGAGVATISAGSAQVTPTSEGYLGGLAAADTLPISVSGLPASSSDVTVTFDLYTDGDIGAAPYATLTVFGEGAVAASTTFVAPKYLVGMRQVQLKYEFTYAMPSIKFKIAAAGVTGTWGIDNLVVSSVTGNYKPTAEDKTLFIDANPFGGSDGEIAASKGTNAIELRGADDECEELTYKVEALPTKGLLYHTSCDNLWTKPITEADLPATVAGPCHRVVYAPQANLPASSSSSAFDAFKYVVVDSSGFASDPATVEVYVTQAPSANSVPVAGSEGLALAFDGVDDVLSLTTALSLPADAFTVEMRFKADSWNAGTLLDAPGALRVSTTGKTVAATLTGSAGTVSVESGSIADAMWHHLAITYDADMFSLYVDGALAATSAAKGSMVAATAGVTVGAVVSGGKVSAAVNGYIDELAVWAVSRSAADVAATKAGGLSGSESGLLTLHTFNLGGDVPSSHASYDATSNQMDAFRGTLNTAGVSAGIMAEYPTYVASTDVFGNAVSVDEDTSVDYTLTGSDVEGGVTYHIATLPLHGNLYDNSKLVSYSPFPLSGGTVRYTPDPDFDGTDVFKYRVSDGDKLSYRQGVTVTVNGVNDAPTCPLMATVTTSVAEKKLVTLTNGDVDGDFVALQITRLPENGNLHQATLDGKENGLITEVGTLVTSSAGLVIYEPLDVGTDASLGFPFDTFAYSVEDAVTTSGECQVQVSIPYDGCAAAKPVAGDSGYALKFDGVDDAVDFGALTTYTSSASFSVELFFKTSSSSTMDLLEASPVSVSWINMFGLTLQVGSASAPSYQTLNDDYWHYLVVTYDASTGTGSLYVDGALLATAVDASAGAPGVLTLGSSAGTAIVESFRGAIDEVSVWGTVRDGSFSPGLLGQGTYAHTKLALDASMAALWKMNEAKGNLITDVVAGAPVALSAAGATAQPTFVPSYIPRGDVYYVVEGDHEEITLACSSEQTDTLDAVILTLPAAGSLYYTTSGSDKSFEITTTPTIVKGRKVIYVADPFGDTTPEKPNYGDFAYSCIGDLDVTVNDLISSAMYSPLSSKLDDVSLLLGKTGRALIEEAPLPPLRIHRRVLLEAAVPAVFDSVEIFYGTLPVVGEAPEIPPAAVEEVVVPPIVDPPAPSIDEAADEVITEIINDLFPATGTRGVDSISAVKFEAKIPGISYDDFIKDADFKRTFEADLKQSVAASAGVPVSAVTIVGYADGSLLVITSVAYATGSSQSAAVAFESKLNTDVSQVFDASFTASYGTTEVLQVKTDTVTTTVTDGVSSSCFQISASRTLQIASSHQNQHPVGCAAAGAVCTHSLPLGDFSPVTVTLPATDIDGDAMTVMVTRLPHQGTLHFGTPTSWDNRVPLGAVLSAAPFSVVYQPIKTTSAGDTFSYVIMDGEATSEESDIVVSAHADEVAKPLTGNTGYALKFDGEDDEAQFGSYAAYGLGAGATFGMWFKTLSHAHGATLLSAGPYRLGWDKVQGLQFAVGDAVVSNSKAYNDGHWHYVVAAFDGQAAYLTVDDDQAVAAGVAPPAGGSGAVTLGAAAGSTGFFGGEVDEFVIFASDAHDLLRSVEWSGKCSSSTYGCFTSADTGLKGYWKFNDSHGSALASEVPAPVGSMDMVLGSAGKASTYPAWVQSSIPQKDAIELLEDTTVSFSLEAIVEAGSSSTIKITTKPSNGQLYVGGKKLYTGKTVPAASVFEYIPKADYSGADAFAYSALNDAGVEGSATEVKLTVHAINDPPTAASAVVAVDFKDPTPVKVDLVASDVDSTTPVLQLTYLPQKGLLYTDSAGTTPIPDTLIVPATLYYRPMANGLSGGDTDMFGYVAKEDFTQEKLELDSQPGTVRLANSHLISAEATVTLDGTLSSTGPDTPVSGEAGLALFFDGLTSVATLSSVASYGMAGSFSVSFWMKSIGAGQKSTILEAGGLYVGLSKVGSLAVEFGGEEITGAATLGAIVGATDAYMHATWVKVEVSFAAGAITVLVDGSEVAKKSGLAGALDPAATVTLGGTSGTTSVFHGYLDELSLGDGSTVSGYYRFNEGLGNTLLNEASGAYDGTLGAAGLNLPARTTSTCPISFPVVVVEEDQGATVELKAYFTDATATGVQYKITDLPAKGGLYTSQGGHAITAVPYTLAGSSVYFAPGAHENGAKYATFSYVASLVGATAADSAPAIVTIDVTEVNDAPAVTPSLDLTMAENEVLQVQLTDAAPSDAELDSTSYVLRTLPTLGHLYTSAGDLITAAVAVADGKVTYVPPPNANGAPYTTFSFVVSDGKLDSQEVTVSITIKGTVALMLSPSSSVFIRDGAPLVSTSSYTVDAWVKTDDLAASTFNILSTTTASASLESGAGAPGFTSDLKFPLTMAKVGDTDVASSRWSHVAFVADTGSKKLYLDGQLVGVQATADTAVTDAGSLTLGGNSMPVCLDEVKIYGRALAQHEVLTSMNERIAVGNEAVGKGLDVYLSSGLGSDLVAYWSFDDVAGKTVPDTEGGFDGEITGSAASVKVNAPMVNNDAGILQTLSASSGSAGYAIHFDGVDDAVQGNLAAAGPTADGLSIDLWVKLSSGSTMDMALVEAGGVALAWTKTGGLGLHLAGAGGVDSHLTLNDGAWHHVEATVTHLASGVNVPAATPGSFQLALKIDGAAFAAVSAFADILASTAYTIGGSADGTVSPFAGTIDEVCFGSAASKAIYGKVSFDEAYGTSLDGGASVLGNPTWVFSSAPLTMGKLSLFEDTEIMVDVQGFDADGDALSYYLTAAPALGSVYNLGSSTPLIACPAKTTTSLAEAECEGAKIAPTPEGKYVLRYVPDSNAYGAEVIQYVADDGYQSSDPAYVVLDVLPVNDIPALTGAGQSVATVEESDVVIQLVSAFDEDGDPLSHVITSLPAHGMLLQYPAEPATVIDSLGTAVSDPLLRVVYRPLALDTADAFTYAATDGNEGMCPGTCPSSEPYFTEEATVAVSASATASNHVPVAGEVGYALVFDGVDDYIYVEGESFSSEPGFTVEMYIKTADANVEYTTLAAAFNPLGEAMKLYMTKFGGLVLEAAGSPPVASNSPVNDGNWHLVTCSVGATVAIVVDGIEMSSSKLAVPVTFDALAIGGQPSSGASSGFFSGLIDDVRVWSIARSANDVLLSKNRIVASGSATGLSIHYPFDGMSTKSDLVLDEAEGDGARDGKVFGGASRTPSSAPLTQYSYTMTEDSHDALYVPLAGTDDDFDVLDFLVTTLPPKGQLYTLEGTAITATPYKVASGSSAGVQYRPAAHGHGAPYTQFGYAVYDGQAMSKEALVNVHVTSVNDAPAPVGLSGLSVESTKSLVITLEATDVDLPADSVTLAASTLPDAGTLYTLNADSTVGVPITAPGTSLVTTVSGQTATAQVVLMPADDLGDLPSHTVSFGFVGMDAAGEVSHEEMVEVEVTQDIVLGQVSTVPDALGTGGFVAGLVGHAIVLDGVAQQVTLPHSDLFEADFTLEVYFKTSAAIHEDIALVTQAGSFFLGWKLFKGLTFVLESAGATGSTSVHTGQTFNDAAWHHVAVTFASSTQQLKIFVDGAMLKAETAEAGFTQVTGSPAQVVLGARGSADGLADNFKGYIDEVRVWGVAKSEAAVAAHRSVKITPGAMKPDLGAGLRVLYTFDGDLQDLCPVAGAACPAAVHLPGPPTFVSSGAPLFMKTLKLGKGWGEGNAMGFYPSAAEGGPDNVGINLLGTDLDFDGLSFEITSLPSHGTVSFAEGDAMTVIDQVPFRMAPGSGAGKPRHHAQVVYTPAPGEYADVAIGYTVWDGLVRSAEALVTIEIEEKNRAPVTGGDVAVTATLDTCGAAVGNDRTAVPTVSYDPALGSTEHKFAPAVWWADSCGGMANIYPVVMEASDADGDAFDVIVTTLPGFGTLYQTADGVTPTLTSKVAPGSVVSYREGGKATLLYSTIDLDAVTDPGTATSFGFKAVDAKGFTSGESTVSVTLAGASADFAIFSGIKGFALMLDGVDDAFDLPAEEIAAGAFHSGFTVGMWVKSTGAILQGSTLFSAVTSAGKGFRASWTHAGGLEVSVELVSEESMARGSAAGKPLSAKAASGKQLNDGQWHFVDIEYDTSTGLNSPVPQVCVRIDDGAGSCTSASELSATFVPSAMALGKDITSGGGTMFKGMVDELRVYGAALTTALHPEQPGWHSRSGGVYGAASVFMHQALMGTEKDLVAYFRFNDVATLQTDNKVMNLVSDKLVPVAGSPSAMSSTVPIMLKVTTEEDEAILLSLTGVEFSAASLNAVVTKLPELGKLHQVLPSGLAGAEITFVPAPVADSANRVIFAPAAREHGVDFGNMKFYTEDPASGAKSDEDTILFSVKPVNYAPVLTAPFSEITITTFEDVAIKLEATDPDDEDALQFVITTVPTMGTLYASVDGVTKGSVIASADTPIKGGFVIFSPVTLDTVNVLTLGGTTYFGYTVTDGQLGPEKLSEALVSLTVPRSPVSSPMVAGDAAYALMFDGKAPAEADKKLKVGELGLTSGFTVETWVKTSQAVSALESMTLVELSGFFRLTVSKITGLRFVVSDVGGFDFTVEGSGAINDGAWHFIAATFEAAPYGTANSGTLRLYVDGTEVASQLFDNMTMANLEAKLVVGQGFTGLMDDLRIWSVALEAASYSPRPSYDWDSSGMSSLSGFEDGLQLYYRFNEASGNAAASSGAAQADLQTGSAMWVPSAAPFGNKLNVAEDSSTPFALQGSGDVAMITLMPSHGSLHLSDDGKTTKAPSAPPTRSWT